jgi:SAM-dependent methyltransferase
VSGHYDPAFYGTIATSDDDHFWYRARNEVIGALVDQVTADLPDGFRVLEVGCGGGTVLRMLERRCRHGLVVGTDLHHAGLALSRRRTPASVVQADIERLPFRVRFHVVGMFDVLEHLEDDREALLRVRAMTEPGGVLLLTVPSRPSLWSYFDEAAQHQRRYTLRRLTDVVGAAGYDIEYRTEFMVPLLPPAWLQRRVMNRLRPRNRHAAPAELAASELGPVPPWVNRALRSVLSLESGAVRHRRRLPFGTSAVLVGRRR